MSGSLYPRSGHRMLLGPCSCCLWNVSLHHPGFHTTLPSSLYFLLDHRHRPLATPRLLASTLARRKTVKEIVSHLPWGGRILKMGSSLSDTEAFKKYYYYFIFSPCYMACGSLVPWPGIEPVSLQYKCWVLTTGPPGWGPLTRLIKMLSSQKTWQIYSDSDFPL